MLIHGRAQEDKDPSALKAEWLRALEEGLRKSGLTLPIADRDVRFTYYGQTLHDLVSERGPVADVITRGAGRDDEEFQFLASIVREIQAEEGISDSEVAAAADGEVLERGVQDIAFVRAGLRLIDQKVPGSGIILRLVASDVHQYLSNIGIRDQIEMGVRAAILPGVPTVVVGHSLGSVVAYAMLRREGEEKGWNVPLFVTVGAPLAIRAIRMRLAPIRFPGCVRAWFNARDERDVVALYPLDEPNFPTGGRIENKNDVTNQEANRHGISGYLSDREVARKIYDATRA